MVIIIISTTRKNTIRKLIKLGSVQDQTRESGLTLQTNAKSPNTQFGNRLKNCNLSNISKPIVSGKPILRVWLLEVRTFNSSYVK
jgi:hypothetical protein